MRLLHGRRLIHGACSSLAPALIVRAAEICFDNPIVGVLKRALNALATDMEEQERIYLLSVLHYLGTDMEEQERIHF